MSRIFITLIILFSFHISHAQTWTWAEGYGAASFDNGEEIIYSSSGFVYTIGSVKEATDFGSFTIDAETAYLLKMSPAGFVYWAKPLYNISYGGNHITIDDNDNIYLTASLNWQQPTIIGNDTFLYSEGKILVAKYDANGNPIWAKNMVPQFNNSGPTSSDIQITSGGDLVVLGTFPDSAYFETDSLFWYTGGRMWMGKFDNDGNELWVNQFGASLGFQSAYKMDLDTLDNMYITGYYGYSANFGINIFTPYTNRYNAFLAKYDSDGNCIWAIEDGGLWSQVGILGVTEKQPLTTPSVTYGLGVAYDGKDGVYYGGFFNDTIQVGDSMLYNSGNWANAYFLARYDTTGVFDWVKYDFNSILMDIDCDSSQNVYITGEFKDSIHFGNTTLYSTNSPGQSDVFVAAFNGNGDALWAINTDFRSGVRDIFVPECYPRVYIAGDYYVDMSYQLGTNSLPISDGQDILIAAIENPTSNCQFPPSTAEVSENNDQKLNVYPNPFSDKAIIDISSINEQVEHLIIINPLGQIVQNITVNGKKQIELNRENLAAGLYHFILSTESNSVFNGTFVVQ